MVDIKLEISYYTSLIIRFFYNIYGWFLSFFNNNPKEIENADNTTTDSTITTITKPKPSIFDNKIFTPFKKVWKKISDISFKWCIDILGQKEVPQHIGFIMDGNRRFAKINNINPYSAHLFGFESLEKNLEWLLYLGVHVVTVYAFSIENFKRTDREVTALFEITKAKLREFSMENKFLNSNNIKVQVIGDLSLLPDDVVECINEAHETTKNNDGFILNICFAYTARYEMANAIKQIAKDVQNGKLNSDDITEETIENNLLTKGCPPVDILVRTSMETRFSDFLLWQICDNTQIHFINAYWPVFNFWNMLPVLLSYQRRQRLQNKTNAIKDDSNKLKKTN